MIRRWTHGHTLLAGGSIGLLLATHLLWTLSLVFLAGVVLGRTWGGARKTVDRVSSIVTERVLTERERRAGLRAGRRAKIDARKVSRDKLHAAYARGVMEGRLDRG